MTAQNWENAQSKEINHINTDIDICRYALDVIFNYFGDRESIANKTIVEVGCGTYPFASFINGAKVTGVEPLFDKFSDDVKNYWKENNINVVTEPFEDIKVPRKKYDEVWFFNFLQHTSDIVACVEKAKKIAKRVRVFEPINVPTDEMHLHTLTVEFFKEHFPTSEIHVYSGGSTPNFHTADCVYFVS